MKTRSPQYGAVSRRRRPYWLVAPVIVLLAVCGYVWYLLELRPVGTGSAIAFDIKSGQSAPVVATALRQQHLIRNRDAFLTYLNFHGLRTKLKAGTFSLSPAQSSAHIATALTGTASSLNQLVIPEGYTITQIETAAAGHGITAASFNVALAAPHTQSGLSTKPADINYEGYLFPDSYEVIPGSTTAASLVTAMLDNFDTKVGTTYDSAFTAEGLTRHQGLTLASIVQKEVGRSEDQPMVAQVFLTRLKEGISLGSDVTVDYAAQLLGTTFSTTINSPYNTYSNKGLPPGPICNPGLSALDAVAHPAATDYLYFVADSSGVTHFETTYAEHQTDVAKYVK